MQSDHPQSALHTGPKEVHSYDLDPKAARTESKREKRWVLLGFSSRAGSLARPQPCCPLRTIILRATPSSCEASRRMRCAILSGGPPSGAGRERCARTLFPETKWSWTAAVSFFSARRPCHTIGYFCREGEEILARTNKRNSPEALSSVQEGS